MNSAQSASLWLCASFLFLYGCAAGWNHTSDAALGHFFNQHRAEFEKVLAEVQADPQLKTLQPRTLIYAGKHFDRFGGKEFSESDFSEMERLGLPRARWAGYQKYLQDLNLSGGILQTEGRFEFRVDTGSLINGDSYKGYEYRTRPPEHILSSLDGYRLSDQHKDKFGGWLVYKPLSGNWYLYLFVNR